MNEQEKKDFLELVGNDEAILWDGFDDAIIGYDEKGRIVYDADKMCEILTQNEGMTEEDAWEHLSYNVFGGYVGEYTPLHVYLRK
jgi:hypothetical protein